MERRPSSCCQSAASWGGRQARRAALPAAENDGSQDHYAGRNQGQPSRTSRSLSIPPARDGRGKVPPYASRSRIMEPKPLVLIVEDEFFFSAQSALREILVMWRIREVEIAGGRSKI